MSRPLNFQSREEPGRSKHVVRNEHRIPTETIMHEASLDIIIYLLKKIKFAGYVSFMLCVYIYDTRKMNRNQNLGSLLKIFLYKA